jgi:hypothetical protein
LLFVYQVQTAFFALAEANVLRPYMREGVAEISKACIALEGKDCAPASACKLLSRTSVSSFSFALDIKGIMSNEYDVSFRALATTGPSTFLF